MPRLSKKVQDIVAATESLTCRVEEAAKMVGISPSLLMRLVAEGKAPQPIRLAGAVRFARRQFLDWIDGGCKPIPPTTRG
jgi:predicted DNA-binding transcriptional regulator AlpA